MAEKKPICPKCGQSDQVFKVNQIYIESLSSKPVSDENIIQHVLNWPANKNFSSPRNQTERQFLKSFYPPSSRTSLIKSVHPDGVVGLFSVFALFLLYQIYITQPGFLYLAIGLVLVFILFYLLARKMVIRRYHATRDEESAEQKNIENAVGKWMRLYYCLRDDGVFDPAKKHLVALEDLGKYLASQD